VAIYHFGTSVDGSVFVEQVSNTPPVDATATVAPQRPPRGLHIKVRNPGNGTDLPDAITQDYGYWDYTTQDIPVIWVSLDNWASHVSIRSAEAMDAAASSGIEVANAVQLAAAANDTANQALSLAQQSTGGIESVNGKVGTVILTAADVQARPASATIPVGDVIGLKPVATSGVYTDLTGRPPVAIPLTDKGSPSGVATLDATGRVAPAQLPPNIGQLDIYQNADGTWPLRNSVSADPTARVNWWYFSATSPAPQAGNGYVVGRDVLYKKV